MIPQFSYTQLSDVNGWIKRIRDIGLKIFMKKRYDEVMDEVAKDVGLQQRTQRVFGIGEKFVGAMSYTSQQQQSSNLVFQGFVNTLYKDAGGERVISNSALIKQLQKPETLEFLKGMIDMHNALMLFKRPKYGYTTSVDKICKIAGVRDCVNVDGTYIGVMHSDKYECRAEKDAAGLGLHCLTSDKTGTIVSFEVTQAASNERLYVPIGDIHDVLIMADRGYPSYLIFVRLLARGLSHNVKFIFRAEPQWKMTIDSAINANGCPIALDDVKGDIDVSDLANHFIDMQVRIQRPKSCKASEVPEKEIALRLVRVYRPHDKSWAYYMTNISQETMSVRMFPQVYRLRWICEQIYKCAKSYTSMAKGINSRHFCIVMFFIVASICVMAIRTIMAAYMRPDKGKTLSLIKVHKHIGSLTLIFRDVVKISIDKVLRRLRAEACILTRICLSSSVSKRDKMRLSSYQAVFEKIMDILRVDGIEVEAFTSVA